MTIEERLDKVEAENRQLRGLLISERRRSKWVLLGLGVAVAAVVLSGARAADAPAAPANQVTAKKFVLVDDQGNTACVLTCNGSGAFMEFGNGKGRNRLQIYAKKTGAAGLSIQDDNGNDVASLVRGMEQGECAQLLLQAGGHHLDETASSGGLLIEKR